MKVNKTMSPFVSILVNGIITYLAAFYVALGWDKICKGILKCTAFLKGQLDSSLPHLEIILLL